MDYPSFPCDLGKNTERERNASYIVFETTVQIKAIWKLEIKWGRGEGYELYLLSGSRESSGDQGTWGRTGKAIPALHLCRAQKKGAAFLAITEVPGWKPGSSPMMAG